MSIGDCVRFRDAMLQMQVVYFTSRTSFREIHKNVFLGRYYARNEYLRSNVFRNFVLENVRYGSIENSASLQQYFIAHHSNG